MRDFDLTYAQTIQNLMELLSLVLSKIFRPARWLDKKRSDKNENRTHVVKLLFLVNGENVDGHYLWATE